MYCSKCGRPNPEFSRFCSQCGSPLTAAPAGAGGAFSFPGPAQSPAAFLPQPPAVGPADAFRRAKAAEGRVLAQRLAFREEISCIFWICIIALQLFLGLTQMDGFLLVLAALNSYSTWKNYEKSKRIRVPYEGLTDQYQRELSSIVGTLIINLLIGGLLGVVPAVYDLFKRNFALKNREALEAAAQENFPVPPPESPLK